MNAPDTDRTRLLRRLAWTGFVLMLLVTTSSAYLRLRSAGLGCEDWPRCYGQRTASASTLQGETVALARVAHRISASAAGVVALLIAVLAFGRRARDGQALHAGIVLVIITVLLAWMGRSTPQATVAAVAMGNLLGGMGMAALFLFLAIKPDPRPRRRGSALPAALAIGIGLTLLQLAYGAMTSASYSGLACVTFPDCAGAWWPADASLDAFDPWRRVATDQLTANMTLHMTHRYGGALLGLLLLVLGASLMRRGTRWAGGLVIALVILQWIIGVAMVQHSLPVTLALLHNVLAGLLLVTLVAALAARIRPREAAPIRPREAAHIKPREAAQIKSQEAG